MPFATDAARSVTDTGGSNITNPAFNKPASTQLGDVLLLSWRAGGEITSITNQGGFTQLVLSNADGTDDYLYVGYKIADNTEGTTITQTVTQGRRFAAVMWRLTSAGTPLISTVATGSGTSVDPPNFNPPGAIADWLWIAIGSCEDNRTVSSAPSNFSNLAFENVSTAADGATLMGASQQLAADQLNPGGFTITVTSNNHMTATVAVPFQTPASFDAVLYQPVLRGPF